MLNGKPNKSRRKTALIAGALIIIAYGTVSAYILDIILIIMLLELISAAAILGLAVLMFPILKLHNKNLTLGYTAIKIIEGVLIFVIAFMLLPLIMNPETSSASIIETRFLLYEINAIIFGIRFLLLSYLLYQSKLVPRFIAVWGLIASTVLVVTTLINLMAGSTVILPVFSQLPVIMNEFCLAIWLIVKGFNEDVGRESEGSLPNS